MLRRVDCYGYDYEQVDSETGDYVLYEDVAALEAENAALREKLNRPESAQPAPQAGDDLPGLWEDADLIGGETDSETPMLQAGGTRISIQFSREQWGLIFDGVMLEISRSESRKAANSESNSDLRSVEGKSILDAIRLTTAYRGRGK